MSYESIRGQRQKRALNMVWTAAGAYDFRPEFLAFHQDGEPDIYLNSIVGFVHRHYDGEKLAAYFRELDKSLLGELFTELFWLGLEEAAFRREVPLRPVLAELRRRHAEQFLADDTDLAMQQLMMRQELAHTLKCARCREILGEKVRLLNPWDKRLYENLRFSGAWDTEKVISAMEGIIERFFRFHWQNPGRKIMHLSVSPRLGALLRKILPRQSRWGEGGEFAPLQTGAAKEFALPGLQESRLSEGERERRFGAPLFGLARLSEIEAELCRGPHAQVCLWFTGERGAARPENLTFYRREQAKFRMELKELVRLIRNCLLVHRQPMELPARSGRLAPGRVWRGLQLGDERVFSAVEPATYGELAVVLLLDASASRESRQALIASQAYLIAEALRQAGVPLLALSFFSEGGCTVLRRLKDFKEGDAQGIFSYHAQGWNRDGLALRALPEFLRGRRERTLLLILTDACPSDDHALSRKGLHLNQTYGGEEAAEDTAEAVKELKKQGFKVLALVNSVLAADLAEDFARRIYGGSYLRLQELDRLAATVGGLLAGEIARG